MRSMSMSSPKEGAPQVEDVEEMYEMGEVGLKVVKDKYLGTVEDKNNMQEMGRVQELRVSSSEHPRALDSILTTYPSETLVSFQS